MKVTAIFLLSLANLIISSCIPEQEGKHLFILSGQSNMVGLKPEESFAPALEAKFGKEKIIIVKDAMGSQPISRWYQQGNTAESRPDLYESLMNKVVAAIKDEKIKTVTFIWMQGERDARMGLGDIYESNLIGLYEKIKSDLKKEDINFIIGRLSDFDMENEKYQHWTKIRDIQVMVAESNSRFDWVDTDDLNDGVNRAGKEIQNDLHMSAAGYVELGKRFAEKSIRLIEKLK